MSASRSGAPYLYVVLTLAAAAAPALAQYGYGSYDQGASPQSSGRQSASYGAGGGYASYPAYPASRAPLRPQAPAQGQPQARVQSSSARVGQWFTRFDQIRRQAQMTPGERKQADQLLSRGMSVLMPGPEKVEARNILTALVSKYNNATNQMKQLPMIPETKELHRGYYQYFNNARMLFSDYLRVQDNLFVSDPQTGKPLAGQLMERKSLLEGLNKQIKDLDSDLRSRHNVPAYKY